MALSASQSMVTISLAETPPLTQAQSLGAGSGWQ